MVKKLRESITSAMFFQPKFVRMAWFEKEKIMFNLRRSRKDALAMRNLRDLVYDSFGPSDFHLFPNLKNFSAKRFSACGFY